jgi:ribose transport system substrate-binding protein
MLREIFRRRRKMKKVALSFLLIAVFATSAFAAGNVHIEIVSKGFLHQFWQNVKVGSDKAAAELGITITFVGPESESMIDRQSEMFETALGKNPQAICFAALDAVAQAPLVARAKARNIPVVTFDATVNSDDPVSFVATDSEAAGAIAADKMNEALQGKGGKVAVIASDQTNTTQILRRDGFVNKAKQAYPNIEIVSVQYGIDPLEATEVAKSVMTANPDLAGYYACNEGTAIGLANAIKELNMKGKIIGIGFDSGRLQLDAIKDGSLYGAIQQNPVRIGYDAVMMAYKAHKGETVPKRIDTGIVWAHAGNLASAEVKAVIYE